MYSTAGGVEADQQRYCQRCTCCWRCLLTHATQVRLTSANRVHIRCFRIHNVQSHKALVACHATLALRHALQPVPLVISPLSPMLFPDNLFPPPLCHRCCPGCNKWRDMAIAGLRLLGCWAPMVKLCTLGTSRHQMVGRASHTTVKMSCGQRHSPSLMTSSLTPLLQTCPFLRPTEAARRALPCRSALTSLDLQRLPCFSLNVCSILPAGAIIEKGGRCLRQPLQCTTLAWIGHSP